MTPTPGPDSESDPFRHHRARLRAACFWCLVVILAWSPFPLGGAIEWAASLQQMLIALCWLLWVGSEAGRDGEISTNLRLLAIPLAAAIVVLVWAFLQTSAWVPQPWVHPIWPMTSRVLGEQLPATISIDPWRSEAEALKLASAAMAAWLAFCLARRPETALRLVNAIVVIGASYALYGFMLAFAGNAQQRLFYTLPFTADYVSGPFMLHNSFATYCGLATLAAVGRLFMLGSEYIVAGRGARRLMHSVIQFAFGRGAPTVFAVILTFSALVASASRAGFASTVLGLVSMALAALLIRGGNRRWTGAGVFAGLSLLLALIVSSGGTLGERLGQFLNTGAADNVRLALWQAAHRMIADAPAFGLGLGTFQDAYSFYATQILPLVMDKAHCDYLEFAAGLGIPAAILWWSALAWLLALCLRGLRVRRRSHIYPLIAVGATVLVAAHESVDFSLQMPAVALLYAVLLGLGTAQAFPSRA